MHPASPLSPSAAARPVSPSFQPLPPRPPAPRHGMFVGYTVEPGHPAFGPVPSAFDAQPTSTTSPPTSSAITAEPSLSQRVKRKAGEMEDALDGHSATGKRERKAGRSPAPSPALALSQAQGLLDSLACRDDGEFLRRVWSHACKDSSGSDHRRAVGQALAERWGGAQMPDERFDRLATQLAHEAGYVPWPTASDRVVRQVLAGVFAAAGDDATRQAWIGRFIDSAFGPAHDRHLHHATVGLRASVTLIRALSAPVMRAGELECLLRHVLVPADSLREGDARVRFGARQLQELVVSLLAELPAGEDAADAVIDRLFAQGAPFTLDERLFLASGITEADRPETASQALAPGARACALIGLEMGRRVDFEDGITALSDMSGPAMPRLLRDLAEDVRYALPPAFLHAFGRTVLAIAQAAQGAATAGTWRTAAHEVLQRILPACGDATVRALGVAYRERLLPAPQESSVIKHLVAHLLPPLDPLAAPVELANRVRCQRALDQGLRAWQPPADTRMSS